MNGFQIPGIGMSAHDAASTTTKKTANWIVGKTMGAPRHVAARSGRGYGSGVERQRHGGAGRARGAEWVGQVRTSSDARTAGVASDRPTGARRVPRTGAAATARSRALG